MTFRYTDNGPVALLTGKKAYVFATRGGLNVPVTVQESGPHLQRS